MSSKSYNPLVSFTKDKKINSRQTLSNMLFTLSKINQVLDCNLQEKRMGMHMATDRCIALSVHDLIGCIRVLLTDKTPITKQTWINDK